MAALLRSNMTMRVAERDHSRMIAEPAIKQCAASPPCLEADVKQHQIRRTWQVMCMSAALHACTTNRSPAPEHLSGTVIQGAGDTVDAGNAVSRAHAADAGLGNAATGNGNTPPNMMMSAGTGGSPGITGSGGQPATTMTDGGAPSGGSGGSRGMMPPPAFDAGLSTPDDDDDDDAPDAATDAAVDTGVDDDDEHEGR
jgi:hypothetical protein